MAVLSGEREEHATISAPVAAPPSAFDSRVRGLPSKKRATLDLHRDLGADSSSETVSWGVSPVISGSRRGHQLYQGAPLRSRRSPGWLAGEGPRAARPFERERTRERGRVCRRRHRADPDGVPDPPAENRRSWAAGAERFRGGAPQIEVNRGETPRFLRDRRLVENVGRSVRDRLQETRQTGAARATGSQRSLALSGEPRWRCMDGPQCCGGLILGARRPRKALVERVSSTGTLLAKSSCRESPPGVARCRGECGG